ncbi:hypothetical protein [Halobacillus salinus]|uniref:hypothetical protein n=1 Tax=Halobacillus salinus TaxID=192814 RepID=UPI0009A80F1E|nr:hypothetical protein [Halobacillus salinus]
MERDRIPYPNQKEMKYQIDRIIEEGLPSKKSSFSSFFTIIKEVGWKHVFRDSAEILFTLITAIMIILGSLTLTSSWIPWNEWNIYAVSFTLSPVSYGVLVYFFFIQKQNHPTFEVEMVCKYDVTTLAALRMFVFSLLAMIMDGFVLILLSLQSDFNVLFALLLCFTSLFICSATFLSIYHLSRQSFQPITVIVGWVVLNVVLYSLAGETYGTLIQTIPYSIYLLITIISAYLYVKQLSKFLHQSRGVAQC